MTRTDFDQWISQHYGELTAVARRLVDNPEDAPEIVNDAVATTLANGHLPGVTHPWTWMVNAVRGKAKDRRVSNQRKNGRENGLPSINSESSNKPGGSPDQIRRCLKKLTPEQDLGLWLQRLCLRQLERDRRDYDMDGYGRRSRTPNDGD